MYSRMIVPSYVAATAYHWFSDSCGGRTSSQFPPAAFSKKNWKPLPSGCTESSHDSFAMTCAYCGTAVALTQASIVRFEGSRKLALSATLAEELVPLSCNAVVVAAAARSMGATRTTASITMVTAATPMGREWDTPDHP